MRSVLALFAAQKEKGKVMIKPIPEPRTEHAKASLPQGHEADMWHAGTQSFYRVIVVEPTTPEDTSAMTYAQGIEDAVVWLLCRPETAALGTAMYAHAQDVGLPPLDELTKNVEQQRAEKRERYEPR